MAQNTQTCPACQTPNGPQEQYCTQCGRVLSAQPPVPAAQAVTTPTVRMAPPTGSTCLKCGQPLAPGTVQCVNCGFLPVLNRNPLQVGQKLRGGRYTIERPISAGGWGRVYRAVEQTELKTNRVVVVKQLFPDIDVANPNDPHTTQIALQQFHDEAAALIKLYHQAIPRFHDYIHEEACIVMDYIEGVNLRQQLSDFDAKPRRVGRPYPRDTVIRWGIELCEVLEYLARQNPPIVHHDIKPDNILLSQQTNQIYLIDFGIARPQAGQASAISKSQRFGTQGYAPLEQFQGLSEPRSDVYALGATLYHLVTDDEPQGLKHTFPHLLQLGEFGQVLSSALAEDVKTRPTATQFRQRLEDLQAKQRGNTPITARDGQHLYTPTAVATWCAANWLDAVDWLYDQGSLADQVERVLGHNVLGPELRAIVQRHTSDRNLGLDTAIATLDPDGIGKKEPQLLADQSKLVFGGPSATSTYEIPIKFTNGGARLVRATIKTPAWVACDTQTLELLPMTSIQITVKANLQRGAIESKPGDALVVAGGNQMLLTIPVKARMQTPDGSTLDLDSGALVQWCEQHWEQASAWLYGDVGSNISGLPDYIETAWRAPDLAQQLRTIVQNTQERDPGLDAALAAIDGQGYGRERARFDCDQTAIDFDALGYQRRVLVTNLGRRWITASIDTPPWITASQTRINLKGAASTQVYFSPQLKFALLGWKQSGVIVFESLQASKKTIAVSATPRSVRQIIFSPLVLSLLLILLLIGLWQWNAANQEYANSAQYAVAIAAAEQGDLAKACASFNDLDNYRDAKDQFNACSYQLADRAFAQGDVTAARAGFVALGTYRDAAERVQKIDYDAADGALQHGDLSTACEGFAKLGAYKDADERLIDCHYRQLQSAIQAQRWDEAAAFFTLFEAVDPTYRDIATFRSQFPELGRSLARRGWESGNLSQTGAIAVPESLRRGWFDSKDRQILISRDGQIVVFGMTWEEGCWPCWPWERRYFARIIIEHISGEAVGAYEIPDWQNLQVTDVSLDGKQFVALSNRSILFVDDGAMVWSKELTDYPGNNARIRSDGRSLIVVGSQFVMHINIADGAITGQWEIPNNMLAILNPDGTRLAVVQEATLEIRNAVDGTVLWDAKLPEGSSISRIAFSADGSVVAGLVYTPGSTGIIIWNARDGTIIQTIEVSPVEFGISPDGQFVVLDDGRIIRVRDRVIVQELSFFGYSLQFAADGSSLLAWNSRAVFEGSEAIEVWQPAFLAPGSVPSITQTITPLPPMTLPTPQNNALPTTSPLQTSAPPVTLRRLRVTVDAVWLRSEPIIQDAYELRKLYKNETVGLLEERTVDGEIWYRIRTDNGEGWSIGNAFEDVAP